MIRQVYSIRDAKASIFNQPFFQNSKGEAERMFHRTVNDPQSFPCQYPEDFDLYYLGDYDDETGALQALPTPEHIVKAIALKGSQQLNLAAASKN